MFQVGQKVVCINGRFPPLVWEWADHVPIEGEIYTVRGVRNGTCPVDGSYGPSLLLEELVNPKAISWSEVAFSTWRFAPLEEALSAEETADIELECCLV
jgi:hypothetical protein